jgi:hypothetical protein
MAVPQPLSPGHGVIACQPREKREQRTQMLIAGQQGCAEPQC